MKRVGGPNNLDPPSKVAKTRDSSDEKNKNVGGWQASLGCSLAERLEKITTVQHLTTRQVKRLLKDVLTNEDVVNALRRYIDGEFKEPETGEVSAATRRRAKSLGVFSILNDFGEDSGYHLESRAITRSLTRRIEESLQNHFPHSIGSENKTPCTILDMEFPDDDGNNEVNLGNNLDTSSVDFDYQPDDRDYEILRRDQVLDFTEVTKRVSVLTDIENENSHNVSSRSSSSEGDSQIDLDLHCDRIPINNVDNFVSHANECLDLPTPRFTRSQAKTSNGLSKFISNVCSEEPENPDSSTSSQLDTVVKLSPPDSSRFYVDDAEEGEETDATEDTANNNRDTNKYVDTEDADNDVYTQFLRSLFTSASNSSNCTPSKSNAQTAAPVKASAICERLLDDGLPSSSRNHPFVHHSKRKLSQSTLRLINDDDDDDDDPEFDVMAELDDVDREDFFYELRDDRAVRVSKMEAKNLHEDLRELFASEERNENLTHQSKTPSFLAMKAYGQRLFHMDRNTPRKSSYQMVGFYNTHSQSSVPNSVSHNTTGTSIIPAATRRRITLTETELVRLERQLVMHIQLLTTNFLLTYDFPNMHESVTRPCATLLKTLIAKRQAFDLVALQQNIPDKSNPVTSFYWCCPTLEMAVDLISDYAGLSMLPRLPWNPYKQGVGNNLTKSQSFALPIPYCLLRIMINSPIWSYACLMPTVLGPHPKSHVRLIFHPSEDALMIMGLADFSGALIRTRKSLEPRTFNYHHISRSRGSQCKQPCRYIAYRLIGRHILPYRTLLQLRSRRWNLLANRDSIDNAGDSKHIPVATRRLLQLYTELSQPGEVDLKGIQQYANEMTTLAVPYGLPLIVECLSDKNSKDLFTFEGLPADVGYEYVLNYNCRGESAKRRLDVLTEFVEHAECFWRSETEKTRSREMTSTLTKSATVEDESAIKLEPPIECDVLGPNYLPAIPVDLNPDGTVVLSKTSEPALVEVFKVADVPEPIHISNNYDKDSVNNLLNQRTPQDQCFQSKIPHHIEFILARINSQKLYKPLKEDQVELVSIKNNDDTVESSTAEYTLNDQQFEEMPNILESYWDHTGNDGLDICQKVADALVNIFHFGFDKFCAIRGDGAFGPRKFCHLLKSSVLNPHSSNVDTSSIWPNHFQSVLDSSVFIADECQSQAAGIFPSACLISSSRFIARCRARGDANSADLLSLPSSVISQTQTMMDEMDVRRARSLLDRCRTYLAGIDYKNMMCNLSILNQVIQNHTPVSSNHEQPSKTDILLSLARVLSCLKNHLSLWEDFVCLLTPSQARSLGLLSTYLNLARVSRVQRVLQDIVPHDRRFWRRLRNLADSCNMEARHLPVKKRIYTHPNDNLANDPSNTTEQNLNTRNDKVSNGDRNVRKSFVSGPGQNLISNSHKTRIKSRVKGLRHGNMYDAFSKTWSVLESSWRNRPVLLARIASFINTRHKPYAGFEQSFEESDILARHPIGNPVCPEESNQRKNISNNKYVPPIINTLSPQLRSFLSEGWEICTDLSSTAHGRNNSSGMTWARRQCPCRCHPNVSSNSVPVTIQSGRPAKKVDSLGLRHCISCSLRVHRGIVYIDECNLHLRHVKITWPPGFKPKAHLPRSSLSAYPATNPNPRPTTIHVSPSIPTRTAVNELAKMHARSHPTNRVPNHRTFLPDMAGRRVSIEFIPSFKSVTLTKQQGDDSSNPDDCNPLEVDDGIQSPCPPIDKHPRLTDVHSRIGSVSPELRSKFGYLENPMSWSPDDEAACFNTEAFACTSNENHIGDPCESVNNNTDDWTPEEDRELLEFCKAKGRYSSQMFTDLARIWEPKPYDYSPQRNALELEERFKHLMRITLREAYDPELFQTPYREDSSCEDDL
ncbi:GON-4 isoform X4 isoform 1 [Schistosoma japonicum]|uniref:GON-4 isoform X4 isoform 1 n=1 Tax=Schistosoma japonicum TaxID=6182 RepID=A0A4Z2CTH8_SCHJA|nr:GON-4 isoform X4 isoform 1 [Schistosoma japonicum]